MLYLLGKFSKGRSLASKILNELQKNAKKITFAHSQNFFNLFFVFLIDSIISAFPLVIHVWKNSRRIVEALS